MASHRFQVGDGVDLLPGAFGPREAQGRYTVTRLLPNDSRDREYILKSLASARAVTGRNVWCTRARCG